MISTQPHLFHLACKDKDAKNCTSKKTKQYLYQGSDTHEPIYIRNQCYQGDVSKLFKAVLDCSHAFVEFCSTYFNMSTDDQVNYAFMIKQNSPRMKKHVLSQL